MGRLLRLLSISLALALPAGAATLEEAARDLSRRILVRLAPRESMTLQVRSLLGPGGGDPNLVERALAQNLRPRLAPPNAESAVVVRVTLNRNPRTHLLVTEIRRGEELTVLLDPYQPAMQPDAPKAALSIEKRLVWQQPVRILDVAFLDSRLVVLDEERVAQYEQVQGRWMLKTTEQISYDQPRPRDLRGRLLVSGANFEYRLAGSSWDVAPGLSASLVAGRNYFSHPKLGLFFSAARIGDTYFIASSDGRGRLADVSLDPAGAANFSSDIAAVEHSCGGPPLLIGTNTAGNAILAYRVEQRNPVPVTDALDLGGKLTALWPSEQAMAATAVVLDPETISYAAYRVSVTCGR